MISSESIIRLIHDHEILCAETDLAPGTDLFSQGLDSVALMQLLLHVEERFGLTVSPSEITRDRFATPAALACYLSQVRAAA